MSTGLRVSLHQVRFFSTIAWTLRLLKPDADGISDLESNILGNLIPAPDLRGYAIDRFYVWPVKVTSGPVLLVFSMGYGVGVEALLRFTDIIDAIDHYLELTILLFAPQ